jgi:protein-L-isoaspartate(D-aspartate) O-methyltransferase
MTIEDYRHFYAEEIRYCADVSTEALVEAYARVPREHFLGPGPWQIGAPGGRALTIACARQAHYRKIDDPRHLYHDVVVVLDLARDINNGQPAALARWIDALQLQPGNRAYHLGCGVGYYTAIIAEVVGSTGAVTGVEYEEDLAARAGENLAGYPNVTALHADGAAFDPGPCDAIFVNAGVTHVQPLWLDRLRDDGRLVLPLTISASPKIGQGVMLRITRRGEAFPVDIVSPVGIYSATGLRSAENEALLRKSMTTGALLRVKSLRRDGHEPGESCLVHAPEGCWSAEATS